MSRFLRMKADRVSGTNRAPKNPTSRGHLQILLDSQTLAVRIEQLAADIAVDYGRSSSPLFIGVLTGAVDFMMRLLREFPPEFSASVQYDFVDISSYDGESSRGITEFRRQVSLDIKNRDVIVVDGIVDTGLTLTHLLSALDKQGPRSIKVCSLLNKPARRRYHVPIDYAGFEIADHFVVGFGMDYNQQFRCLSHVAVLDQH